MSKKVKIMKTQTSILFHLRRTRVNKNGEVPRILPNFLKTIQADLDFSINPLIPGDTFLNSILSAAKSRTKSTKYGTVAL
jgi:hypothetical protein